MERERSRAGVGEGVEAGNGWCAGVGRVEKVWTTRGWWIYEVAYIVAQRGVREGSNRGQRGVREDIRRFSNKLSYC